MVDAMLPQKRFYVYVIFRPSGEPCYVGKGQTGRWRSHIWKSHNQRLQRIVANAKLAGLDIPILKVREGIEEAIAFEVEAALIAAIGRDDLGKGPLVNLTNGGEGASGKTLTESHKNILRSFQASRRGYRHTLEAKKNMADAQRLRYDRIYAEFGYKIIHSLATRAKISIGLKGIKQSLESKLKRSAALSGRKLSAENKINIGLANKGRIRSEESKNKNRLKSLGNTYSRGHVNSSESINRISSGVKASYERRKKELMLNPNSHKAFGRPPKLNADQRSIVRQRVACGGAISAIARDFGVSVTAIRYALL